MVKDKTSTNNTFVIIIIIIIINFDVTHTVVLPHNYYVHSQHN